MSENKAKYVAPEIESISISQTEVLASGICTPVGSIIPPGGFEGCETPAANWEPIGDPMS